ncbi:MAG: 4-(cytidine 5'-diphospho)-2-C-methyl-D-erythritol kinase [Alphaproteobacteria bacterium]
MSEPAFAKINLWLSVLGRRTDGFHDIDALAVFADLGDTLTARPAPDWELEITGPFAGQLSTRPDNLVLRAAQAFAERFGSDPFHFTLEKNLPVAAGLGGGSADAAAVLRMLARHNKMLGPTGTPGALRELVELAARLGADIPVCLDARAARMAGTGTKTTPVTIGPGAVLLVNPRIALCTAQVFASLGLQPRQACANAPVPLPKMDLTGANWLAELAWAGNDLEKAARQLVPEIGTILEWIARSDQCQLARMTGSGPTCFGLYRDLEAAQMAQRQTEARFPRWWVASSILRA